MQIFILLFNEFSYIYTRVGIGSKFRISNRSQPLEI